MFDVVKRWITLPDPVRFAGWCGETRKPVLSDKLTHTGGTTGDLDVIEFCDENFGTTLAVILRRRCDKHVRDYQAGHGCEGEYREECNAAFADTCTLACKTLRHKGITVVDEFGCPVLDYYEE